MALSEKGQRVLARATELIGMRENWIKGSAFRDKDGDKYGSYCAVGAVHKAAAECGYSQLGRVFGPVEREVVLVLDWTANGSIVDLNDHPNTTHEEIKQAFCKTLKQELSNGAE